MHMASKQAPKQTPASKTQAGQTLAKARSASNAAKPQRAAVIKAAKTLATRPQATSAQNAAPKKATVQRAAKTLANASSAKRSPSAQNVAKKATVQKAAKTLANARSTTAVKRAPQASASTAKRQPVANKRGSVTQKAARHATQQQLQQYKLEAARELGISLNNGTLTRKQAGQLGGQVVKKMVAAYERSAK
jgi:small acid-soluble spore protein D (minor alpha/beta-type SASP)